MKWLLRPVRFYPRNSQAVHISSAFLNLSFFLCLISGLAGTSHQGGSVCGLDLHFPVIETMIKHCWLRSKAIKGEEEPLDVPDSHCDGWSSA